LTSQKSNVKLGKQIEDLDKKLSEQEETNTFLNEELEGLKSNVQQVNFIILLNNRSLADYRFGKSESGEG
jgi:cell division protein FtsB